MDGTIPRGRLPEAMLGMEALSKKYGLRVANVFHAGDGNLHPLILYDASIDGDMERAEALGADILRLCVSLGGVLTGEHGVGVEKRDLMGEMFSETDLEQQMRVKCAFDPQGRLNPGKVFPTLHRCAELGRDACAGRRLAFPGPPADFDEPRPARRKRARRAFFATPRRGPSPCSSSARHRNARSAGPRRGKRYRLSAFSGVSLYEPEELVLTAGAATPRAEIEALLDAHGQELAFEPIDFGALFGRAPARSAGSSRPAPRDRAASRPGPCAIICSAFAASPGGARSSNRAGA